MHVGPATGAHLAEHVLLRKVARLKVKVGAVDGGQFCKKHIVGLALARQAVAIEEAATFRCMRMKVNVECKCA